MPENGSKIIGLNRIRDINIHRSNPNILNSTIARATNNSTRRISSARSSSSSAIANRRSETVDVLADSVVPASRSASAIGEVRTSLGVALEEPQHPVRSSLSEEAAVRLPVCATVADVVQVAFPGGQVGGESGVVSLAL
jgi:hypothetical protein